MCHDLNFAGCSTIKDMLETVLHVVVEIITKDQTSVNVLTLMITVVHYTQ